VPHASAAQLEAAIAALNPDAPDATAIDEACALADGIAADSPALAQLARTISRTLHGIIDGDVQPHHAQWRLASAALTLTHELERDAPSAVSLAGAVHDLETLFPPLPSSPPPPSAEDVDVIHPAELVRNRRD